MANSKRQPVPLYTFRFDEGQGQRSDWQLIRPRDAATLMIVDSSGRQPRVLMGRRHERHRFMPGKYVFPGGRVDPGDRRMAVSGDFRPEVMDKLLYRMRSPRSAAKARGLALAAVRETLEETGLLIGERTGQPPATRSPGWRVFQAHGVTPSLEGMMFIARAITPPRRPRRFDTRFFAVDAGAIADKAHFEETDANELLEINWLTFDEARDLDLPNITRFVIGLLQTRLESGDPASPEHPVPFYFMRGRRSVCEEL